MKIGTVVKLDNVYYIVEPGPELGSLQELTPIIFDKARSVLMLTDEVKNSLKDYQGNPIN